MCLCGWQSHWLQLTCSQLSVCTAETTERSLNLLPSIQHWLLAWRLALLWLNYPTSQNRSAVMVCSSNLDPGFQQHTFYIHHIAIMLIKMFRFFFLFATSNYNVWLRPLQSPSDWNGSTEEERLPTDSSLKFSVTNFFFLLELWW